MAILRGVASGPVWAETSIRVVHVPATCIIGVARMRLRYAQMPEAAPFGERRAVSPLLVSIASARLLGRGDEMPQGRGVAPSSLGVSVWAGVTRRAFGRPFTGVQTQV